MLQNGLSSPWRVLKIAFGVVPIVAGADKFFNLLTQWEQYLSPLAAKVLPFSGATFMQIAGVIEIAVGLAILTKATRIGAYVAAGWLAAIAVNLLTTGQYFDVAVRDLVMACGAYTLAKLEEARLASEVPAHHGSYGSVASHA